MGKYNVRVLYHFHPTPTRTELGAAWAMAIDGIAAVVKHFAPHLPALAPVLAAILYRFPGVVARLDRLILRWQAGTLPKPRPSRAGHPRPTQPSARERTYHTRRFWLIRLVQRTAQYGPGIELLLARPDTRALVEAAPQAGRLLRPLCRAFNLAQPDWLRLPSRPPSPRPTPRPRRAPRMPGILPGMLPTDRPLPPCVVAAVRHYRKTGR